MVLRPAGGSRRGRTQVRTTVFARPTTRAVGRGARARCSAARAYTRTRSQPGEARLGDATQTHAQSLVVQLDLLERDSELGAVSSLIGEMPAGGRLLAVEGPPGIGKTALLAEAKALAQVSGSQVLGARGSELERSFSYGVVRQLFEPFLASLREEERAELLSGAAGLAAPLFDPAHVPVADEADSSLATLHGLYWLTANLAERRPLLLAVDDLHWCDLPSLRWLAYLLPRMDELAVLVVAGLRLEEPGDEAGLIRQIVSDPLATVIRPAPLSAAAAALFLRQTLGPDAEDAFCAACREETAGNPLLLRELAHVIAAEGLAPTEANVPRLRGLAARAGSRAVSLRLSRLPPEATTLAQAVAILGDDADPRQTAALAGLDEEAGAGATDALARADVLSPQPPLGFVHPLIRAAVYETLTPLERDRGHARAARLLADAGAEPERVATHLLRSPPGADAQVVAILREAAQRARARGAPESAVAYLRRALAEPPLDSERAELLLELGSAEVFVDGDAAIEHLRGAHELIEDPIRRAEAALLLGHQLFLLRGEESDAFYTRALEELGGADAELERLLEAGLITNRLFAPSLHRAGLEWLERVRNRLADQTVGEKLLLSLLAYHDARAGVPAAEVVPLARRALAAGTLGRILGVGAAFVPATTVLAMADLDEVLAVYEDALAEAHRRGSTFAFAAVKVFRAQTLVWRGDLSEAEAEAREALGAGESWGASARFAAHASAFLADALMEQGRLDDAAAALARAGGGEPLPDSASLLYLGDSSARLRILRGDLAGGLEDMLQAGRRFESVGSRNPAFIAWRSPAAVVLLQLGEQEEARRLAAEELELARIWGAPRALGAALRAAGLVEGGAPRLALLEQAVQVLSDSPAKLEHAKARTEYGAALRRANHRSAAREHLRHAVELATICGATALAQRAERELLATGARPRRVALSGVASLTPSERRVAEMAAAGPTNREIAQSLFVTQRTVEVHLTSIYRKLAISSRSQLAAALAEPTRA
jgi:DNA-binding CsgD family transcriptional regulator/tetratricopeptide (TPR) repeat protein